MLVSKMSISQGVKDMKIDLYMLSAQLLERLGNSIYDRNGQQGNQPFTFTIAEIHVVENWLLEILKESLVEVGN